ncbi:MAG: hypothetical protein C0405_08100, partial [Desulfovibrio sp.]|nr:hypothetical protein [Desulfovibrio sp.]
MNHILNHPFDAHLVLRKKRALRRELLVRPGLLDKRIAILGGSTTAEARDMLELFLLKGGIRPAFYESEYGRFAEDALYDNPELDAFAPEVVYLHTTSFNISILPGPRDTPNEVEGLVQAEFQRFLGIWEALFRKYGCLVVQNNFELPDLRLLGNQDCVDHRGRTAFIASLNQRLAGHARRHKNLLVHDLNLLSARFGLDRWHDPAFWHAYKYAMCLEAAPHLGHSLAALICAAFGRTRKCLVLDLDNTLWGGVIGDDGVDGILLGHETPEGEAYLAFQRWLKDMRSRGVMLAVCSKNDEDNARFGFSHPDSVLGLDDFTAFCANWEPKHENIRALAKAMNIGLDSMVFVDDNPAERALVAAQLPEVAVPDVGQDVSFYPRIIERAGYFETTALSAEDLARTRQYADNAQRTAQEERFHNYDDFLRSLQMTAEIRPFAPVYLERIAQLTNKTNQFNLTTRRYSLAEIEAVAADPAMVHLYGRLTDTFGDNGLVSVVIARVEDHSLDILLWLMSCRVLKRGMEDAMFDALLAQARARGLRELTGSYLPTAKNSMVSEHYARLGFTRVELAENGDSRWRLEPDPAAPPKNSIIR